MSPTSTQEEKSMQKKLIALAIAGMAAAPAFAQSNVTIYGIADVYYGYGKTDDGNKFSGINSGGLSGSRLGFKGTEDLGNGLKALFVYELGTVNVDSNSSTSGAGFNRTRQTYVGLGGNWGTAVAGRLQSPGYDFGVKYDTFGAAVFSPVGQLSTGGDMTISGRNSFVAGNYDTRLDNAAAYISPSFGGVTLKAAYAFGEQIKTKEEAGYGVKKPANAWALAADYDNGPLSVGAVWHDLNGQEAHVTGLREDQTEWALGASYDFTVVKLTATYQQAKNKTRGDNIDGTTVKSKLWNIGAAIPVGPGAVKVAYADWRQNQEQCGTTADPANCRARSWAVDYEYGLSKRTTAYVGYSQVKNKNSNDFVLTNISGWRTTGDSSSPKSSQLGFGVRHVF
jgi:predicted porin